MQTPARPKLSKPARAIVLAGLAGALALFTFGSLLFPGNRPLYEASDRGDEETVRQLLLSGADPNSRSQPFPVSGRSGRYRSPPLAHAVWHNQPGIALLLLEAGADPNARHDRGETPLMLAVNGGHANLVSALIRKGADVNATLGGATALRHGPYADGQLKAIPPEIERLLREGGAR